MWERGLKNLTKGKAEYFIYNLFFSITLLFIVPYFIIRNLCLKKPPFPYLSNLTKKQIESLKGKPVIWIHVSSVGEIIVVFDVTKKIHQLLPEHKIIITTITSDGYNIARQKMGDIALVTYFPLDLPILCKRFINRIHPSLFILVEAEFWPNAIRYSKKFGAKVALVNGRVGHSMKYYLRFSKFMKVVFDQIDLFSMKTLEDANRIKTIGAPLERVIVTGDTKIDQEYPSFSQAQLDSFREKYNIQKEQRVFTVASTLPGEEEIIIESYLNLCKDGPYYLILAPRHPNRAKEIGLLLQQNNLPYYQRSSTDTNGKYSVLLLDTFGELGLVYAVADVVFVAGNLFKKYGGHNIMEAAVQGKPVIYGPYMKNSWDHKLLLEKVDAGFVVHDAVELADTAKKLLADEPLYRQRAFNAKKVVMDNRGTAQKTANLVVGLLKDRGLSG